MINPPKTLKEAKEYLYGQWAGNPDGVPYKENKCAWSITRNMDLLQVQCSRKNGHGPNNLYCKQHARMV